MFFRGRNHHKLLSTIFSFFLILTGFISIKAFAIPSPIYADGPCQCVTNPDTGNGICGNTCSSDLRGVSCGQAGSTGGNEFCNNIQKRYACENVVKFTPFDWMPWSPDPEYFCTDPNDPSVGVKGSWSEVFKQCFCSTGEMVQKIVTLAIYAISIIALIVLGVGGIKYITSQNNPDKITEAKETIIAAIAGMLLIILAVAIIRLLNNQLPGEWGINFLYIP